MAGVDKRPGEKRAARLEAELRANLKKRKEQAKVRARPGEAGDTAAGPAPSPKSED
jgi:hypothetical protein